MRITEFQEDARLSQSEFRKIVEELEPKGYSGILRSTASTLKRITRSSYSPEEILEFSKARIRPGVSEGSSVELFAQDAGTLYLLQPPEDEGYDRDFRLGRLVEVPTNLQLGFVSDASAHTDAILQFGNAVNDVIRDTVDGRRLRGMTLEWKPLRPIGRSVRALVTPRAGTSSPPQYENPEYSLKEAALADDLAKSAVRAVLIEILEAGKTRLVDVVGRSDNAKERSATIASLANTGLVTKEYLVVCQKSSRALTHVASLEEIKSGPTSQLPCAECGRKFSEERTEEIILPTELARTMMSSSRWMQIWLTVRLERLGIPRSEIVWNLVRAAEDIDVIAGIQGTLMFFELKDREFGLGDAYPFNYRVARYGGEIGIVLTCDKVAQDAKTFFEEQTKLRRRGEVVHEIHMIEGLEAAERKLEVISNSVAQTYLEMRLEGAGARLRLSRLVTATRG